MFPQAIKKIIEFKVNIQTFVSKFKTKKQVNNNSQILNRKINSANIHEQIRSGISFGNNRYTKENIYKTYSDSNNKDLHPRVQLKNNLLDSLKRLSHEFKNQPFINKGLSLENHIIDYIYHYLAERVIELRSIDKLSNPIEIIHHTQIIIKEALDKQVLDYNTEMEYNFNIGNFLRFCQISLQEKKHTDLIRINTDSSHTNFGHPLAFGVAKINVWE